MKSGTLVVIGVLAVLVVGGYYLATQQRNQDKRAITQPTGEEKMMPNESDTMVDEGMKGAVGDDKMMAEGVKNFTLENEGLSYTVKEMRVKKGDTVRVTFKVVNGNHDWNVDEFDAHTKVMTVGGQETVEFVADKAGEFEYYCSVPGHRAAGMVGTLIVE